MYGRTLFLIAYMCVGAVPSSAQQAGATNQNDFSWAPPTYSFDASTMPGNVPMLKGRTDQGPACTPTPTRVSEGACVAGAKTVAYSDGCGGQSQRQESCATGKWEWYYRVTGLGGGGTSTSSVIMLACVQDGTATRISDDLCGPKPTGSPSPCLVGQSYQTQLPQCADFVGPLIKYPTTLDSFWGAGASRNF